MQHLPRALNRTTLSPTIAALDSLGYHTFLAGTERLLILNGDMWHPSFALPLVRYSVYLFYRHKSTITDAAADIWHPSFAHPLVTPTCQAFLAQKYLLASAKVQILTQRRYVAPLVCPLSGHATCCGGGGGRRSWEGGGEADVMTFVAVKAAGALYPQLLSAYNSSGMVIGCVALLALQRTEWGRFTRVMRMPLYVYPRTAVYVCSHWCICRCVPYRMSSFHTPDGYCPPLALCIPLHFSAFVGYSVPNFLLIQYLIY
jgi:hypothetical protein